ncbi:MAG: hypothetical protein ABI586_00895 [Candidatus Nanopelagicales bacterium]
MKVRSRDLLGAVHWIANSQLGLVTAAQLAEIGFASASLARYIRTGGPWRRILPGIYCVGPDPLTVEQRELAGLLFAGAHASLTGTSALRRRGLRYLPEDPASALVHTLIPDARHRKSSGFVIVERTHHIPNVATLDGLPCAPVARAVIDAGRRLTSRRDTRAILLEAVQRGMTTPSELAVELRRAQRRGTALLGEALADARSGVRSAPEAEVRDFVLRTTLPEPLWNPQILLPDGSFLAEVDGLIQESMVAIEVDSRNHHAEGQAWDDTLDRHSDLTVAGLIVVHIVPARFRANPTKCIQRIIRAHRQGLARQRPDLRIIPKPA